MGENNKSSLVIYIYIYKTKPNFLFSPILNQRTGRIRKAVTAIST